MNSILPNPTRAALLLKEALQEAGTQVTLSTAQEAVARTRGHNSFQTLLAEFKAHGNGKPAAGPLAHLEGMELWCISGRCWGDDDDTVAQLWGKNLDEAKDVFRRTTLDLSEEDIEAAQRMTNDVYFINSTTLLGVVVNGQFSLSPAMVDNAT